MRLWVTVHPLLPVGSLASRRQSLTAPTWSSQMLLAMLLAPLARSCKFAALGPVPGLCSPEVLPEDPNDAKNPFKARDKLALDISSKRTKQAQLTCHACLRLPRFGLGQ